jgi:hypothetical protein
MKNLCTLIIILLAFTATVKAQVSEQEFLALKALYNATDGDNWINNTGWENINTTATKDDVNTAWFGIGSIEDGHITEISMHGNNNLTGSLPPEIGNLIWLRSFNIGSNKFSGPLPTEFGNLINLTVINLSSNQFSGPLPASLANLVNLVTAYLGNNPLNIPFPSEIMSNWPELYIFQAYGCGLTGELPDFFENFPKLYNLNISGNKLTGTVPVSISKLTKLYDLSLSENIFTGNLPSLDSCKVIKSISFNNNNMSGSIPESYNQLKSLFYLFLDNNNFTGIIPGGFFTSLRTIIISNNFFTFEGLEPVINKILNVDNKSYSTNKFFPLIQNNLSVDAGESINLNASTLSVHNLGGNNNRYKWFCNNIEVYSGNSPLYSVPSASTANAGIYRFEVTNTVVTGVTLKSDNITVSVVGSNQAPTDISLNPLAINENFTGLVGTLAATDPDSGDTHTFTLTTGNGTNDRDNNKFSITGNQLSIYNGANFETNPTLNILISVNDGNGGIFTKAFVITVNNVNEAPFYNGQVTSNTIDENAANGSTALTLMAQDPESNPITFSIISGNENGAFGINGNKLVVADNTKLNYDVKNSYSLTVNASDGTLSANITLTVNLNKINRMPDVENAIFNIDENSLVGTAVGSIVASDREGDPLVITITGGNASGAFAISGKNISVANSEPLDYEITPTFTLTINVTDGISNVQATVTINLNNVAEPTDNAISTFFVPGMVGEPEIDIIAHTIRVYVSNVDLRSLAADFTLSSNANSNPLSGTTFDFTSPQTITVTSQSGDPQEWVVTVTFRVGKDDFDNLKVKVYPNPAKEGLTISGLLVNDDIKLISLRGEVFSHVVALNETEEINIQNLNQGTYFVVIESARNRQIQKIIKL